MNMGVLERYLSQASIAGWDQQKISSTTIAVVGASRTGSELVFGLAEMGYKNFFLAGTERLSAEDWFFSSKHDNVYCCEFLRDTCHEMNGDVKVTSVIASFEDVGDVENALPGKCSCIVETTNNPQSKYVTLKWALPKKIPVVSIAASENSFCVVNTHPCLEKVVEFHIDDYEHKKPGYLNASVVAALALDEVRKTVMPLPFDYLMDPFFYDRISDKEGQLPGKVLMVGAGGVGSSIGKAAALLKLQHMTIIDYDKVEIRNLGNQIWYYDLVEQKKSLGLAAKMLKLNPLGDYTGIDGKFDASWGRWWDVRKFDLVLGCADDNSVILMLQDFASRYKVPMICPGSSTDGRSAAVLTYLPGKTQRLDEQDPTLRHSTKPVRGAGGCYLPSCTIPSRIAAALSADQMRKALMPSNHGLTSAFPLCFDSGLGVYTHDKQ